jgi:urease accessory protein
MNNAHCQSPPPEPIESAGMLAQLRLYQLYSPALPVGGFTYSQGIEWAVEAGWVVDKESFRQWLLSLLDNSLATLDLPVLLRLQQACSLTCNDAKTHTCTLDCQRACQPDFEYWVQLLIASRETKELRLEERQRGAALARLLPALGVNIPADLIRAVSSCQLAGLALAANHWQITPQQNCLGYAWSWLENNITAGIKLVPLGQTDGQQLLLDIAGRIPSAVALAADVKDANVGSATPGLAIASSQHEQQYTRLFRS